MSDHLATLDSAETLVGGFAAQLNTADLNQNGQNLPLVSQSFDELIGLTDSFALLKSAVAGVSGATIMNMADAQAYFDSVAMGAFTVQQADASAIVVTLDLALSAKPVTVATDLTDFFGGAPTYLSEIVSLSGAGTATLDAGSAFQLTFGADASGFFIQEGGLFANLGFDATLSITGQVKIGTNVFRIDLDATGILDVDNIQLTLSDGDATAGERLRFAAASDIVTQSEFAVSAASTVSLDASAKASVLGITLVEWGSTTVDPNTSTTGTPLIKWAFASDGELQAPVIEVGTPTFLNVNTFKTAILNTLLPDNLFGLDQFGVDVGSITQLTGQLEDLQFLMDALSLVTSQGFSGVNPQDILTGTASQPGTTASGPSVKGNPDDSGFAFAGLPELISFAMGNPVDLVTYTIPDNPGTPNGPTFQVGTGRIELAKQVATVITFEEYAAANFELSSRYKLKLGVDSANGLFVDPQNTAFTVSLQADAFVGLDVKVAFLVPLARGSAGLLGTYDLILSINDDNATSPTKLYVKDILPGEDVSNPGDLGAWLADQIKVEKDLRGDAVLHFRVNTPEGAILETLPPEIRQPLVDLLEKSGAGPLVDSVKEKVIAPIVEGGCDVADTISVAATGDPVCSDESSDEILGLAVGDIIPILDHIAGILGIKDPDSPITVNDLPSADPGTDPGPNVNPADLIPGFEGIYHVPGITATQQGGYTWRFEIFSQGEVDELDESTSPEATDEAEDHIKYRIVDEVFDGDGNRIAGTLEVTGTAEKNSVRIVDVGDGEIQLVRFTTLADGTIVDDPLRNFTGISAFRVVLLEGDDSFSMSADLMQGASVDAGAGDDEITTGAGNDTIDLGKGINRADAGAGNDFVIADDDNLIIGGPGNDVLIGGPGFDIIVGNEGNDVIIANGGNDQLFGGEDHDQLDGGDGNDFLDGADGNDILNGLEGSDTLNGGIGLDTILGGADADLMFWEEGDGDDTFEGGTGSDLVSVVLSANADVVDVGTSGTTVTVARTNQNPFLLYLEAVEQLAVNFGDGADTLQVGNLANTALEIVGANLGVDDGDSDLVVAAGRSVTDEVHVTPVGNGIDVDVEGLPSRILIAGSDLNSGTPRDTLRINAAEGNDCLEVVSGVENLVNIVLDGGLGDDFLSADAILIGGPGDDFLEGGAGDDQIFGNDGNDTMIGHGGSDTYDGGAGLDTILILGTPGNDVIQAVQTTATTLTHTVQDQFGNLVDGGTQTDTFSNTERVQILAGDGDDLIRVSIADALNAIANSSLLFDIDGGEAHTRDRLAVIDDGTDDLTIYRKGESDETGSFTTGPALTEPFDYVFVGIEYAEALDNLNLPITQANNNGRVVVFKHDPFEANNDILVATHLGVAQTINVDPTIDPGSVSAGPPFNFTLPGDEDWYRVEALATGTLDFQVFFDQINAVGARPGLPGGGDLDISLFDATGDFIAASVSVDNNERIRIPAVQGQIYHLRVAGFLNAINNYSISVINEPAPVPFDLELQDTPVNPIPNPPGGGPNSDTGRSQFDNVTYDNTPTLFVRLDDGFLRFDIQGNDPGPGGFPNNPPDRIIPIPFQTALLAGFRIAIFDEGPTPGQGATNPQIPLGFVTEVVGSPGLYSFTTPALSDGSHFLSARVQIVDPATPLQTGFGARSVSLEIIVDTVEPNVSFGDPADPDDGLQPDSDTGVAPPNEDTLVDRITSDTTPSFWGRAEANTIIRLFVDHPVLGIPGVLDPADVFIGQDTAIPLDGTNQEPDGYWEVNSIVNFNDPAIFPVVPPNTVPDGLRTVFVTAEDLAGNVNPDTAAEQVAQELEIFIDTQGPRINEVEITDYPDYDLFNPKGPLANQQGPTPVTQRITIHFTDLPFRDAPDFLYLALKPETVLTDHFQVFGDQVGRIAIDQVILNQVPPADGQAATATVTLVFRAPLPDDRFTLVVTDDVRDIAGNRLDGETNAAEPQEDPRFPSGDGVPGGDFIARFTIDTRPELGVYAGLRVYIDLNGNAVFDPEGQDNDAVNRDIVFRFGSTSDSLFAGQFVSPGPPLANVPTPPQPQVLGGVAGRYFDQIAAYGRVLGAFRFVFDFNSDGVADLVTTQDPAFQINGTPVAGNFNLDFNDGDEVGLFTGTQWFFDTNHDFEINGLDAPPVTSAIFGFPQVGDIDGDTLDDLVTFQNDTFYIDFASDGFGNLGATIPLSLEGGGLGFPGASERPAVADMNQDGVDDIGVWVPGNLGQTPGEISEFYFLVSQVPVNREIPIIVTHVPGAPIPAAIPGTLWAFPATAVPGGSGVATPFFQPVPFGTSLFAIFGDDPAFPLVGNFDPPVVGGDTVPGPETNGTLVGHPNIVVASKGAGSDPKVVVYDRDSGEVVMELTPYNPNFRGGVQVATGDVNGDGVLDIITAPGRGNTPLVRVFDGRTGQSIRDFFAYDPNFTGGVFIAVGDFNADDRADIVTAPAKGGGPQIRVFSGADGHRMANFFAYDRAFTGGVHVAVGNTDGVGHPEIITAPDRGGGPQVRTFNLAGQRLNQIIAYDSKFTGGVFVAAGDVDGDQRADIITGAGAGGGPQVRVFSGADNHRMASFFAYATNFYGGARVATGDYDGDGRADIYTGAGAGTSQEVRVFDGDNLNRLANFFAFPTNFTGGVFIAAPAATGGRALHASFEGSGGASLSQSELDAAVAVAISQLEQGDVLSQIPIRIVDLPGTHLGLAYRDEILIDADAAGHGWSTEGIDLQSVLAHELGHVLGLDHSEDDGDLMSPTLSPGESLGELSVLDAVFAELELR